MKNTTRVQSIIELLCEEGVLQLLAKHTHRQTLFNLAATCSLAADAILHAETQKIRDVFDRRTPKCSYSEGPFPPPTSFRLGDDLGDGVCTDEGHPGMIHPCEGCRTITCNGHRFHVRKYWRGIIEPNVRTKRQITYFDEDIMRDRQQMQHFRACLPQSYASSMSPNQLRFAKYMNCMVICEQCDADIVRTTRLGSCNCTPIDALVRGAWLCKDCGIDKYDMLAKEWEEVDPERRESRGLRRDYFLKDEKNCKLRGQPGHTAVVVCRWCPTRQFRYHGNFGEQLLRENAGTGLRRQQDVLFSAEAARFKHEARQTALAGEKKSFKERVKAACTKKKSAIGAVFARKP